MRLNKWKGRKVEITGDVTYWEAKRRYDPGSGKYLYPRKGDTGIVISKAGNGGNSVEVYIDRLGCNWYFWKDEVTVLDEEV